jgi:hypothetical protein
MYFPGAQSLHGKMGCVENLPTVHFIHLLAPIPSRVSVTAPGKHFLHETAFPLAENVPVLQCIQDSSVAPEYLPGLQAKHWLAPDALGALVMAPFIHILHATVDFGEYDPLVQAVQASAPDLANVLVVWPLGQFIHVLADLADSMIPYLPGSQSTQIVEPPSPVEYVPLRHAEHGSFEDLEARPALHDVQTVPPGLPRVSVIDPEGHTLQLPLLVAPTTVPNLPVEQPSQAMEGALE